MDDLTQGSNSVVVYGTVWCPDCKRVKKFLGEQRVPLPQYRYRG